MSSTPDPDLLKEIEAKAVQMAWEAGQLLRQRFGSSLEVEYKGKGKGDPVTDADKASQDLLKAAISEAFPDHGIVSEEDVTEEETPAPDLVWVLDPLDGTTNFLNGLPIYAVSIGVLYRGEPVAGSLFLPWPEKEGGIVAHARRGGGAYFGEREAHADPEAEPQGHRLVAVPGHFDMRHSFRGELRSRAGEPRVLGSIAYELALVALGVFQYTLHFGPRLWDVAGGAILVMEAGGTVLTKPRRERRWKPLGSLFPTWDRERPTLKQMGRWSAPMVSAGSQIGPHVAEGLKGRLMIRYRIARMMRGLKERRRKSEK